MSKISEAWKQLSLNQRQRFEQATGVQAAPLLTDAERALLVMLADHPNTHELFPEDVRTLRGLLDRLGHQ